MESKLPETGVNAVGKKVKRSVGPFGWNTIWRDGQKYMTRLWIGHLRLHYFWHSDLDGEDPHSHPWNFWTFPLHSYVEEVTEIIEHPMGLDTYFTTRRQIVPAFKWNYRPGEHLHRVLGKYSGNVNLTEHDRIEAVSARGAIRLMEHGKDVEPYFHEAPIITIVWRGPEYRKWGFLKHRDGRYCFVHWKEYVLGTGRNSPCQ